MTQESRSLPRAFYTVSSAAFMYELALFTTQPIMALYILDFGVSILELGIILAVQSVLLILLRIPLTIIAQRIGEMKMLQIAFLVLSTSQVMYAFATAPVWLYLLPFYQILANGSFFQLATAAASNMAPQTRQGDALGRYMFLTNMGMFLGPIICSALLVYLKYPQLFLVSATFPTVGLLLLRSYTENRKFRDSHGSEKNHNLAANSVQSLGPIFHQRNVIVLATIRTLYSMSNKIFTTLFVIYAVQQLGNSPSAVALLFSILGLTNTLIKIPAGLASDRFGRKPVLLLTFGAVVANYVALAYIKDLGALAVLIGIFGACWGTRAVTEWSYLSSSVTPEQKTIAISFMESFWDTGTTIGSILSGILASVVAYQTTFLLAGLMNLAALPAIYVMNNTPKPRTPGTRNAEDKRG